MNRLTATHARAAATDYGWSVVPHDNGGFSAQSGEHSLVVVFNGDGSFRQAYVRKGLDGTGELLSEDAVVGAFAQHGRPRDPSASVSEK